MSTPPNSKLSPLQLAILAQALQGKPSPGRNALGDLASQPKPTNALTGLLGLPSPSKTNALGMFRSSYPRGLLSPGALALLGGLPKTRHVFHSFHYADVRRVNQIRMCDQFRTTDPSTPRAIDRSLWESAKKTNPASLSRMIDRGLEGTSVTCVLAGYETWSREWVRYEIARSLSRGNGLLTVYINNCRCPTNGVAPRGPNPLDQIALGSDMRIYEWDSVIGWKLYARIPEKLTSWPKWLPQAAPGYLMQLSAGANAYDWIADEGVRNLIRWTDAAALAAGK